MIFSVDNRQYCPRRAKYCTRLRLVQYFSRLGQYRLLSTSNHPILYNYNLTYLIYRTNLWNIVSKLIVWLTCFYSGCDVSTRSRKEAVQAASPSVRGLFLTVTMEGWTWEELDVSWSSLHVVSDIECTDMDWDWLVNVKSLVCIHGYSQLKMPHNIRRRRKKKKKKENPYKLFLCARKINVESFRRGWSKWFFIGITKKFQFIVW